MISLEGADCSGKSTLAEAIVKRVVAEGGDLLYLHGSPWPGTVQREHARMLSQAQNAVEREAVVVLDHFWIAEQLYGMEYRGAVGYDPTGIDHAMKAMGAVICLCVPNDLVAQVTRHASRRAKGQEHFDQARGIVERYNALPVAVEVLGGGWHGVKARHAERTPYILDAGWHLVMIWDHEGSSALSAGAADYLVSFAEEVRRNPPATCQYRVISGNGQLLAACGREDNEFPLVPPSRGGIDLSAQTGLRYVGCSTTNVSAYLYDWWME